MKDSSINADYRGTGKPAKLGPVRIPEEDPDRGYRCPGPPHGCVDEVGTKAETANHIRLVFL